MSIFPLENPNPDFEAFKAVLLGEKKMEKVRFAEFGVAGQVRKYIIEKEFGEEWVSPEDDWEGYWDQTIDFYYRMGYDYIHVRPLWKNMPEAKRRVTADTAELSSGNRSWVEQSGGIIKSREDFNNIDWDKIEYDLKPINYVRKNLPEGMKVTVGYTFFEMVFERFFGYNDFFMFIYDKPELIKDATDKWGELVLNFYQKVKDFPEVGAFFHSDDLGDKNSTFADPEYYKEVFFPWFKKYATLAHQNDKMFWLHSCGNHAEIRDYLIDMVKVDAFQSFQDIIIPIREFFEEYDNRAAGLGGIDMDKLARMEEADLREYVRNTIEDCFCYRFALGSGNTVANYIPPENYLIMLEEGVKYTQ